MARNHMKERTVALLRCDGIFIRRIGPSEAQRLVDKKEAVGKTRLGVLHSVTLREKVKRHSACGLTQRDIEEAAGCYGGDARKRVLRERIVPWREEGDGLPVRGNDPTRAEHAPRAVTVPAGKQVLPFDPSAENNGSVCDTMKASEGCLIEMAADLMGISVDMIRRARAVQLADPGKFEEVKRGERTLDEARKELSDAREPDDHPISAMSTGFAR